MLFRPWIHRWLISINRGKGKSKRKYFPRIDTLEDRTTPTTLPAGFSETLITTGADLNRPTAMEFTPTGQLWALEQGGAVKVVNFSNGNTSTAGNLTVDSAGERGLLGIAFPSTYDGAGPNADQVYLYYTATSPNVHNRLSRFVVNNAGTATPTLGAETVVLNIEPEPQGDGSSNHNGGAIHFGPDGKLYIAIGDHNADGSSFQGATHVSQRLDYRLGKILRINPDGTNPTDNPFYVGNNPIRDSIYALGLRNPYTFAFQPGTGRIFVNDVGEGTWEEINDGVAGSNFGWASEGTPGGYAEGFESSAPSYVTIGTYRNPLMAYDHSDSAPSPFGCAVTGGIFYPSGSSFGSAYAGKFFFADYCGNFIRVFNPSTPGSIGTPDNSSAFASGVSTGAPVDLKLDAAGNLYYLAGASQAGGEIYRISYNAPVITQQPANVTVTQGQSASFTVAASGGTPLSYQWQKLVGGTWTNQVNGGPISGATSTTFTINPTSTSHAGQYRAVVSNSSGSATSNAATLTVNVSGAAPSITTQPSNQSINVGQSATFTVAASGSTPLNYQWQRADSATPGTFANIAGATATSYTVTNAQFADHNDRFRVVVTNSFGTATSNAAILSVNRLPTATFTAPPAGATYVFNQTINFAASASDPEDGTLPASAYTWRVDFAHDAHFHPHRAPFSGATSGSFVANFVEPDPDQFYRIILTVTDSKGATFTTSRDVAPVKVQLTLASNPAGAPLTIDGQPVSGAVQSVVGSVRTISAPPTALIGGTNYTFSSWSDGGAATHDITTPASNTTYTATYQAAAGFIAKVNFQDTTSAGFAGYVADTGAVFGNRGNGFSYGWNVNNAATARNRNAANSPDERYDTFQHLQKSENPNGVWEIAVPNGTYSVHIVAGDPSYFDSTFRINVEGVLAINGTPTSAVRWLENTLTVTVSDGRLTVSNAAGASNNKINYIDVTAAGQGPLAFQQDAGSNGLVVMEVENNDGNVSQGGKSWTTYTATAGFSGASAQQATSNTGVNNNTGYTTSSPRLDFRVNFVKTGIHYVCIRGLGPSGDDDSLHVGIDGAAVASADRITSLSNSSYTWTSGTMDGVVATINVASIGIHTINVWMREDGTIVDKLLLTTSSSYVPTGLGPAESPRSAGATSVMSGAVTAMAFDETAATTSPAAESNGRETLSRRGLDLASLVTHGAAWTWNDHAVSGRFQQFLLEARMPTPEPQLTGEECSCHTHDDVTSRPPAQAARDAMRQAIAKFFEGFADRGFEP